MTCDYTEKIKELNTQIDKLPMCEERDNLIKHRVLLEWIMNGKKGEGK